MEMIVQWESRDWSLDTQEITLAQAFVIKDVTKDDQFPAGRNLQAWELGIRGCEPNCVRALYWLMLQQEGRRNTITSVPAEFPVLKFHSAWADAVTTAETDPAELEKVVERAERQLGLLHAALDRARAAAEPDEPERPTRRTAGASAPSSTPSSTTPPKSSGDRPG